MKYFRTMLLSSFMMMLVVNCQQIKKVEQLKVIKTQLSNQDGNPVVLRGISYGWHNWWPRFYNAGTVNTFANKWNATVVRAAMGVGPAGNDYLSNPERSKELVSKVVDAAIVEGIYVIIDWHSHHIYTEEAKTFFSEMSAKYGNHSNVIYEIFNEPVDDSWDEVKEYSIEIIDAIRANDPDNLILIGSPHWDQDIHIAADDTITGYENIMYTLHFYAATHKEWLRERGDYAIEKGIGIFVSECAGMEASGDGPIDKESWDAWVKWMEANKISWVNWSIADKNETCSMLLPSADSEGTWKDDDLKEWGKITKQYLQKYNINK